MLNRLLLSRSFFLWVLSFLLAPVPSTHAQTDRIHPPGFRPAGPRVHALVGARLVLEPGQEISRGTLVIRDGRIEALGDRVEPPKDAQIWDASGWTVYAGFIEPYLVHDSLDQPSPGTDRDTTHPAEGAGGPSFYGVRGQERDPGAAGAGYGNIQITPEIQVGNQELPRTLLQSVREQGFTTAHLVPERGIVRGQSTLVALGDSSPNAAVLRPAIGQVIGLDRLRPSDGYPNSLMGRIALIRQTFLDAAHYAENKRFHDAQGGGQASLPWNRSLDALEAVLNGQPVFLDPGSLSMTFRFHQLQQELGWKRMFVVASGQEWRRPDFLDHTTSGFIVTLDFPELPSIPDEAWDWVDLDTLRAWDWAPENPALLRKWNKEIALSSHGLRDRKVFRERLQAAMDRGLSEADALAALTTIPARWLGMDSQLGRLAAGRPAFLTVVDGPSYFDPKAKLHSVWIDGNPIELNPGGKNPKPSSETSGSKSASEDPEKKLPAEKPRPAQRERVARSPQDMRGPSATPQSVWVRNVTLWTCGPQGRIEQGHLLICDGKIQAVTDSDAELDIGGDTWIVNGQGLHVTPGLIDAHSHSMILGGVNESGLPSTAMVRIADVVQSESENIPLQLAGGLTIANLLHGSANPIGGQNAVIKLKDGASPDGLVLDSAPQGIKFALGENVKQSRFESATRFPQSRMGVPTFFVNRFRAAQEYQASWDRWKQDPNSETRPRPRRDLELEALSEILEGTRLIHCHSYRQDEILAFLRTMESFDVRIATLQHVLEGYKVADEIARHGAGASAFSDWWGFKYEVLDAIPYAGSILFERGVRVSFNSDSSDHARRMNLEAAKAVKYGNVPEEEALKFVTLNPAIQLGIDDRVGSLEVGKDGDFVLWSGHPLHTGSVCLETWIEGHRYFERGTAQARTQLLEKERAALLDKARANPKSKASEEADSEKVDPESREHFFHLALERARRLTETQCLTCDLH